MSNLATITNNILADSGIDDINVVVTTGSYADPAWITSLSWTKITGAPSGIVTGTGNTNYLSKFTSNGSTIGNSAFFDGGGFGGFNSAGLFSRTFVVNAASGRPLAIEAVEFGNVHSVYIRPNNSGFNLITSNYLSGGVFLPLSLSGRENNSDLVLQTSGNVGIGTSSPATQLNVGHENHGIGFAYLGASSFPPIAGIFTSDGTAGGQTGYGSLLIKARTDYAPFYSINFFTASSANLPVERMRITSGGNVELKIPASTTQGILFKDSGGTSRGKVYYGDATGEMYFGTITGYSTVFVTNDIPRMSIFSDGNVSISNSPSNAGFKLDVNGTGRFSGVVTTTNKYVSTVGNNQIVFESLSATTGFQYLQILNNIAHTIFGIEGTGAGSLLTGGTANASVFTSVGNTNLEFGTNQVKRLTIAASTGAATFSSSVTAGQFLASSSSNAAIITSTGTTGYGLVAVGSAGGARDILLAGQNGFSNGFSVQYTGTVMKYGFQDGNVGIGNTSALTKLHITQAIDGSYPTLGTGKGALFVSGDSNLYGLYIGINTTDGNSWFQTMRNNSATAYNIVLNPAGGNLLVGTTTDAGFKLDVNGTGRFSNILVANSDIHQVSTGGLYWGAASTYVIGVTGNTANGNLSFITGSTVKLTIASTGAATFSSTLQTGGDISLMNASGDIHIRMKDSSGNADRVLLRQATTNDVYVGDIDSNNGRLILRTNGNDAVTIASSGAVQINNISGSGNRIVIANSSNTLISAVIGSGLAFDGTTLTATGGSSGSISGSGTSGTIALFTGTSSIGNSVISQTSGSIGIGTATPNRKLEVITGSLTTNGIRLTYAQGVTAEGMDITYLNTGNTTTSFDSIYNSDLAVMQFRMKTFGTPVTALSILGSGAATFSSSVTSTHNTNGQIAIVPTTNTNAAAFLAQNAGGGAYFGKNNSSGGAFTGAAYATVVYSGGNVPMGFYTNDAERFRITSDGTIGFNGNSGIGNAGLDKMSMGYLNGNYGWIQTWSGTRLLINPSGNNVLIGTATDNGNKLRVNGTIWSDSSITATSFFESSDATIKTLVQDNYQAKGIESVVAKLYIKNGKQELGYFAQDLESILPSAVNKGTDGLLNLSYREVHTAKIAALEKEINELKKQLKNN